MKAEEVKAKMMKWIAKKESERTENGNGLFDVNSHIYRRDGSLLAKCLAEKGVKKFTFSAAFDGSEAEMKKILKSGLYVVAGFTKVIVKSDWFEGKESVNALVLEKVKG